jgi:hypothetical protein
MDLTNARLKVEIRKVLVKQIVALLDTLMNERNESLKIRLIWRKESLLKISSSLCQNKKLFDLLQRQFKRG